MRPHRSLKDITNIDDLIRRIGRLDPATGRRWGTMTAHGMLCHLGDSFLAVLGDRPATSKETWIMRTAGKWIALHTSLPWPHGMPTTPEVDQNVGGSKPVEFERDRTKVVELLRRFVQPDARCVRHPAFGAMTRDEWLLWGYGHVDHHLRQFGLQ